VINVDCGFPDSEEDPCRNGSTPIEVYRRNRQGCRDARCASCRPERGRGHELHKAPTALAIARTAIRTAVFTSLRIAVERISCAVLVRLRRNWLSTDEHLINRFLLPRRQPVEKIAIPIAIATGSGDRGFDGGVVEAVGVGRITAQGI